MQIHRHTQLALAVPGETHWFTGAFSLPGSTMLLFSLLAWGELAQVEPMDVKVVEWLVGVGGNCLGGEISLLMGNMVCVCARE